MHKLLFGVFGISSYLVAPLIIYVAIMVASDSEIENEGFKVFETIGLIVLISGAFQIFFSGMPVSEGLINKFTEVYAGGVAARGGGIASFIIGIPLYAMFGKVPAAITTLLLIFLLLMILTGTTLFDFFSFATKPYRNTVKAYTEKVQAKEDEEEAFPSHPVVSSPRGSIQDEEYSSKKSKHAQAAKQKLLSALDDVKPEKATFGPEILAPEVENISENKTKAEEPVVTEVIGQNEDEDISSEINEPKTQIEYKDDLDALIDNALKESIPKAEEKIEELAEMAESIKSGVDDGETQGIIFESADPLVELPNKLEQSSEHENTYHYPSLALLKEQKKAYDPHADEELKQNADKLIDTLKSFGVGASIVDIAKGPAVTRYELSPSPGVKISKITNLSDDIALNLAAAGVRIEAPIPNKAAVGIEVPNKNIDVVTIREILSSKEFEKSESKLSVALGKNITGNAAIADIGKMPHVLIAGATGSGKSVCINSIIISLIYKSSPDEVKLLMVDPKVVELGTYNGIPHLLVPVVTDPKKAAGALSWAVTEMLNRYKLFADEGVRDLKGYNKLTKTRDDLKPMPQIVIIIDELADLMMASPTEVEDSICRLAQMARAAGMHLVIATQRPSVDVITGVIKANIPSRIAFAVSSQVDSRTILDSGGAEKLLGRGDMLFYPVGSAKPTRIQGCFVSDDEVEKIVNFIKNADNETIYDETIIEEIEKQTLANEKNKKSGGGGIELDDSEHDEVFPDAVECIIEMGQASTSMLQRKLKLGYARAARVMDELEEEGYIGEFSGSKPREVLITRERWLEKKLSQNDSPAE
ncbi:MAG: DNA translocase FtsK [Oscillospiraceae bacterium]